jgi:MFS family permease
MLATVVNMIGSAALFGFVLIYFHEIRHIPLAQAGLAVGAMSFTMVLLTPVAGFLSDHFGARRVLTIGCLVSIVAAVAYAFVESFLTAVAVSVVLGIGNALWFPAQAALLTLIVGQKERPAVIAWQRASLNIGAALGGVVGGFLLHASTLSSFYWLFAVNAATYVVFLGVLPGLPPGKVPKEERARRGEGFAVVLRDKFFVRLLGTDISIALGFGFLWAFTPAYASTLGINKLTIGILFTIGSAGVAITQIPTLGWVSGGKRMSWLIGMNAWFAGGFVLMLFTPHVAAGTAVVFIAMAQLCGGFGESILGAVRTPLTSDLAPPELVGRYFGLATMVFQVCTGMANTIGGVVMQHSLSAVWLIPLVASLLGMAGLRALRHQIPEHAAVSA